MQRKKQKSLCRKVSCGIIICLLLSLFNGLTAYADTWPDIGESAIKSAQPHFSGYRVRDMEVWSPLTDPHAELMQAKVPLQKRNEPFRPTQVNPKLTAPVEVMLMQGDYGNSFFDSTIANNSYGNVAFNFWQYTDYFSPWHGAATIGTPRGLYDPANSDWRNRGFEFGIVNIPNQAYINAAHKNGVMAIACVYFDPAFRPGQSKSEMFAKDENGKYIVANKLIEMARYYGFDGYFLNDEEYGYDEFKPFMAQISAEGLWTQFYDTNSSFDARKSQYLKDDTHGKIHDSVFVNYGWHNVDGFVAHAREIDVDPYKAVFLGIEANQGAFTNAPNKTGIDKAYDADKNPKASVALFTPSDMYQRGIDSLTGALGLDKQFPVHQRNEYQWMIAERERMYFSGVKSDPTDTGKKPGFARPEVVVDDASGWVGVADFKSESSVISGKKFYSNFNIGKGVQYFADGKMVNDEAWTNLNDQDILPTWQWWFDTKAGKKLKADFDFGAKDVHNDTLGKPIALPYTQVGAWHGGSSLVVYGELEAGKENFFRIFKTDLDVVAGSKAVIRYRKSSTDNAEMKLGVILKDNPQTVEKLPIDRSAEKGEWVEATVDLSGFAGKKVATLGFVFESSENVANYQMNIGQLRFTNEDTMLSAPERFQINRVYVDGQMILYWDEKDYSEVDKYRAYSVDSKGARHFLGGIYGSCLYVKNHFVTNDEDFRVELVAVSKDGVESTAATDYYKYSLMPKTITVRETEDEGTKVRHAAEAGKLEISWTERTESTQGYQVSVYPLWQPESSNPPVQFIVNVPSGTSYTLEVPDIKEGWEYNLVIYPLNGGRPTQGGIAYLGRFHDSYAEPMKASDVRFHKGDKFSLLSPLTRDWKKVTAEFVAKDSTVKTKLLEKVRGVSRNYHSPVSLGASQGTLYVTLEDYSGNSSVLEVEYDQSYKEGLKELVKELKPLTLNREQAKLIYTNPNLDEILDNLAAKIAAAEKLIESFEPNKDQVLALEEEIKSIKAGLTLNPDLMTLTLDISYPDDLSASDFNLEIVVKNAEEKVVDPMLENKYPVKVGAYTYSISDKRDRIFNIEKSIEIKESTVEKVELIRKPYRMDVKNAPSKTVYKRGEELELSDGSIELRYFNPSGRKVLSMDDKNFTVSGYDSSQLGEQVISISGFEKTVQLRVSVVPADNEPQELSELLTLVKRVKPVLNKNKFRFAKEEAKAAFQEALTKAEEILGKTDNEAAVVLEAKNKLQEAYDNLDGDLHAPLEIEPTATLGVHMTYALANMLDKDVDSFAWLAGAQKRGHHVTLSFSRSVKVKGFTLQYPSGVGSDFIRGADVEVFTENEWKKVGEIGGAETQTVNFDEVLTNAVRIVLNKEADNWYKIAEWTVDYADVSPKPGEDDLKEKLKQEIDKAKAFRENYKYYNASEDNKLNFEQVIKEAEALYESDDASDEELTQYITVFELIYDIMDGEETTKGKLQDAVQKAKAVMETAKYKNATQNRKEAFDAALSSAEGLVGKANATQKEVDEAESVLVASTEALDGVENQDPQPNPQPQPAPEVLLPYIPEVIEEPKAPAVVIEDEKVALASPEEQAKFEELTKTMTDEKAKEAVKEFMANKIGADRLAKKLSESSLQELTGLVHEKFADTKSDVWFAKELGFAAVSGLVGGFEDNTFRGEKEVSGKELVTMLVRASGKKVEESTGKDWFAPYLKVAGELGLLKGLEFDLAKDLSRQEVAALAYNFLMIGREKQLLPNRVGTFKDREEIDQKYRTEVDYLWEKGVLKGYEDDTYRSGQSVKRQEVVAILYRLLKNK